MAGPLGAAGGGVAEPGDDVRSRIVAGHASLSPQEQRAADFILDHLDDLALFSATEIAERSGVSKATVSRLFRRLGFADAQEVRDSARQSRPAPGSAGSDASRARDAGVPVGGSGDLAAHLLTEHANLEAMLRGLADGRLEAAVARIAEAREVVVVGFRNSYPVALHLRQQLAQARGAVRLAPQPGQSVGEELTGLDAHDAVVLVGFRRRPAGYAALVASLTSRRIPVVALTDTTRSGYGPDAVVITVPTGSAAPFDSYAAPMSLVSLLASGVLAASGGSGTSRVADVTGLYAALDELGR